MIRGTTLYKVRFSMQINILTAMSDALWDVVEYRVIETTQGLLQEGPYEATEDATENALWSVVKR